MKVEENSDKSGIQTINIIQKFEMKYLNNCDFIAHAVNKQIYRLNTAKCIHYNAYRCIFKRNQQFQDAAELRW